MQERREEGGPAYGPDRKKETLQERREKGGPAYGWGLRKEKLEQRREEEGPAYAWDLQKKIRKERKEQGGPADGWDLRHKPEDVVAKIRALKGGKKLQFEAARRQFRAHGLPVTATKQRELLSKLCICHTKYDAGIDGWRKQTPEEVEADVQVALSVCL